MSPQNIQKTSKAGQEFVTYLEAYERYLLERNKEETGLIRTVVKGVVKSVINRFGVNMPSIGKKCKTDILMLHHYYGGMDRTNNLSAALEEYFSVRHEIVDLDFIDQILNLKFCRFDAFKGSGLPGKYRYLAGYCSHLLKRFDPKIIITFIDAGLFPAVLKVVSEIFGCKLVNIAHGVTGTGHLFSAFTFDYYFIFGRSSLDHISSSPLRLGSTKAVMVGSPFIGSDFELPVSTNRNNIIFFSQWIKPEERKIVLRNLEVLATWARRQKGLFLHIKPHPLENVALIRKIFGGIEGVTILDKGVSFKDALEDVALCITQWSIASVEAAVLLRPTICLNTSDMYDEFLELGRYFGTRARSPEDLQRRIDDVFSNYHYYVEKCSEYARRHLEHVADSIPNIVERVRSIYAGEEEFPFVRIPQKIDILREW